MFNEFSRLLPQVYSVFHDEVAVIHTALDKYQVVSSVTQLSNTHGFICRSRSAIA